ncbi:MAG: hypothetical protein E6H57_18995 [Betaproteobacteria bacterium]|nr:MAG: hypothetical protein E6H57_18995 [Betaproteobacteria bacterium]
MAILRASVLRNRLVLRIGREWAQLALFWAIGIAGWLLVALAAWRAERSLREGALVTGYALLAMMLALAMFNLKKRLVALPLSTARAWMMAHLVIGTLGFPLYLQHAGGLWPGGHYERALALCFYTVMLSGIAGYVLQRLLPRRLTHLEGEVIYERIPSEVFTLRERVEALVLKGVQDAGADTLGRYYLESLHWFFRRPRFFLSHLFGSARGARWIRGHVGALRRYLNETERAALDQIESLALRKNQLDAHYALQSVLKLWLFVHIPSAVLLIVLAFWHLLVVNIYSR